MRSKLKSVMILGLVMTTGCSYHVTQVKKHSAPSFDSGRYRRVAVLGFERSPLFQQALTIAFLEKGIQVIEREKIVDIVREQQMVNKNFSDLSDIEKARRLGRVMDVDLIVCGGVVGNSHRYEYHPGPLCLLWGPISFGIAMIPIACECERMTLQANETGHLEALGDPTFEIWVHADVGATWRGIEAATGEIVGIGNRILGMYECMPLDKVNQMSRFGVVRELCGDIVGDCMREH